MKDFLKLKAQDKKDLILKSSSQMKISPQAIEKDFWVCYVLKEIFDDPNLSGKFRFKGGTSLSKAYEVINRFSEDIDLILNWSLLTDENPNETRSNNKQNKINENLNLAAGQWIQTKLKDTLNSILAPCEVLIGSNDHELKVKYPSVLDTNQNYLKDEVLLEIGPLASWLPNSKQSITPYLKEITPKKIQIKSAEIYVIDIARTFWEKMTILHQEAYRTEKNGPVPNGYARHYYDVYMILKSEYFQECIDNKDILEEVVVFKKKFYRRAWDHLELAKQGSLKIIPSENSLRLLKSDFKNMKEMFFSEPDRSAIRQS
ncbi:nucleotidyl transferase AbiEii/AbiGii toxin family protein [bacterium]|nr:nucleotidyl transferase AbiEii/AbiGii toxin family protein [bacterium]